LPKQRAFLTPIQDQVILTRNYKKYILKQPETEELCRRCGKELETIHHITAACEQLAPTKYVKRHDELAKIVHQKLAETAEFIDDKSPYYKYTPANVLWTAVAQSLRCCATNRKVAGSIPASVSGFFIDIKSF